MLFYRFPLCICLQTDNEGLIEKFREQGVTHVRCQTGGYGGTYGGAPAGAPSGAPKGVYLNSSRYVRDTVRMFDQIRAKIGFDIELCHDVHERISPIEAIGLAKELE